MYVNVYVTVDLLDQWFQRSLPDTFSDPPDLQLCS